MDANQKTTSSEFFKKAMSVMAATIKKIRLNKVKIQYSLRRALPLNST